MIAIGKGLSPFIGSSLSSNRCFRAFRMAHQTAFAGARYSSVAVITPTVGAQDSAIISARPLRRGVVG
eukprot:CAMPEP_0201250302 /NCGR_PEP_ID=MMETSP0852-20130820/63032_1 /ASSEMBLY_ACC=CAM_ASM_000632 /TAXON_ID=183588 /ORGANISM="Pseudo-nitzschia fraudulenta, Strain WWA7" /LENGTH=67 /DNA_ID=CAMNT_0047549611 /DNA_START=44 /DNA_END=243 /DNA_ORIENTATION=+